MENQDTPIINYGKSLEDTIILSPEERKKILRNNKPVDTENHKITTIQGKRHETTVFKFRDPRASRGVIFRSEEGLEWALKFLIDKTNKSIYEGEIEGDEIELGNIVQACVVSYTLNDKIYKPETTPDSPKYATLPYEYTKAEEGYLTTKVAVPKEMLLHMTLPITVGDLIPTLNKEELEQTLIALQLKESTIISKEEELEQFRGQTTGATYTINQTVNGEVEDFYAHITKRQDPKPTNNEWSGLVEHIEKTASESQEIQVEDAGTITNFQPVDQRTYQEIKKEKLKKRESKRDQQDFGFQR